MPQVDERIELKTSYFSCPICSPLHLWVRYSHKGGRRHTSSTEPRVNQYRIERMYCKKCREAFNRKMEKTIAKDFDESIVQTFDIGTIERAILSTDKLIDLIIYQLYLLTQSEQGIVEEFAR